MDGKLKLLFLGASPLELGRIRNDAELRDINEKVRAALPPDRFEIAIATATRRDQLQGLLLEHCPDIVHFSGHGDSKRGILLENAQGKVAPVNGVALAGLFSIIRGKPSIVVLNACSTKRTARAFQNVVDYTIAMNGPIADISAIAFASAFYEALARGLHVPGAFGAGLSQLRLMKLPSKTTPELFVAPGVRLTAPAPDPPDPEEADRPTKAGAVFSLSGSTTRDIIFINGGSNNHVVGKRSRR